MAIVGASADRAKYSNKAIRAYINQGWDVYPVNPRGGTIEGLKTYARANEIPDPIDRVSLYLPPAAGVTALADIAALKPAEFFVNPGAESEELVETAHALGLDPILACSIIDVGISPEQLPDD